MTAKKEEFPGFMENMLPGNSFPQICVVSVNHSVENSLFEQDYLRSVHLSNRFCLPFSNTTHLCAAPPPISLAAFNLASFFHAGDVCQ